MKGEMEMSLVRWYPRSEVSAFHDGMGRMIDELFRSSFQGENGPASASWKPPVDIYETDSEVVLKADLPEIDEKKRIKSRDSSFAASAIFHAP